MSKKSNIRNPFHVNIICLGLWDKKIFTPHWVSTKLLKLKLNTEFEVKIAQNTLDAAYRHNGLHIIPQDSLLDFSLIDRDTRTYKYAISIYNNLVKLFPHSLSSMGINIKYKFDNSEKNKVFDMIKKSGLIEDELNLNQIKFVEKDSDKFKLNIVIDIEKEKHILNFNFHYTQHIPLKDNIIEEHIKTSKTYL